MSVSQLKKKIVLKDEGLQLLSTNRLFLRIIKAARKGNQGLKRASTFEELDKSTEGSVPSDWLAASF